MKDLEELRDMMNEADADCERQRESEAFDVPSTGVPEPFIAAGDLMIEANPALDGDARALWRRQRLNISVGMKTLTREEFRREFGWGRVRWDKAIGELKSFGLAFLRRGRSKDGRIFDELRFSRWPSKGALKQLQSSDAVRKALNLPTFATELKRVKEGKPCTILTRAEYDRAEKAYSARSVTVPTVARNQHRGSKTDRGDRGLKTDQHKCVRLDSCTGKSIDLPAPASPTPPKLEDSEHHQIIKAWCEVFEEATGEAYLIGPRDAKAVKVLREAGITLSEARRLITEAFEVAATQDKSKAFAVHVATESLWQFADRLGGVKKAIAGLDGKRRIKKTTPEATKNGLDEMSRRLNASHSPRHL